MEPRAERDGNESAGAARMRATCIASSSAARQAPSGALEQVKSAWLAGIHVFGDVVTPSPPHLTPPRSAISNAASICLGYAAETEPSDP